MPFPVLVVDDDVGIHYANAAALRLTGSESDEILRRRGGEVLHCIHAQESADGCGRAPACRGCVIRNSIKACLDGNDSRRSRIKLERVTGGKVTQLELLISARKLNREKKLVVLVLEDISELSSLRQIVAICSYCRKLRDSRHDWHTVESFFHQEVGLDFSHCICPTCLAEQFYMLPTPPQE